MTKATAVAVSVSDDRKLPDRLSYRPDIDGLRGVAILAVLAFHAFPSILRGGFVGVDIFFVISGFLISGIVLKRLQAHSFTFGHFYAGRVRRIVPALVLTLFGVYAIGRVVLIGDELRLLGKHIAGGSAFLSNFLLWAETGYFDAIAQTKPLLHLWSLAVEEQFYLVWPVTLFFAVKYSKAGVVCAYLIILSLAVSIWWSYTAPSAAFYLCVSRFWEILLGSALAINPGLLSRIPAKMQGLLGVILIASSLVLITENARFPGLVAFLPTSGALLLVSAGPDNRINRYLLGNRYLVFAGLISYPLYLFHWPLLSFLFVMESGKVSLLFRVAALSLSIALACGTYWFVERPIRFGRPRLTVLIGLCTLLVLAGLAGFRGARDLSIGAVTPDAKAAIEQMAWTDKRSADCDKYSLKTADCLVTGKDPRIALLGDSHAMALAVGLNRFLGPKVPVVYLGTGGCPALMGLLSHYRNDPTHCSTFTYQPSQIREVTGQARLVILTSREAWYLNTPDWYLETYGSGEAKKQLFIRGYSNTIAEIERLGRQAMLAIDVPDLGMPDLGFGPTDCVDVRPARLTDFKPRTPCALAFAAHLAYTRGDRDVAAQLKREHPKLLVFDPTRLFCDQQWCYAALGKQFLYRDSNHLSVRGAEYVAKSLIESLPPALRSELQIQPVGK